MTDQDTTQQLPAADPPPEPQPNRPRRLVRSRSDRMLGGVAGGLGDYFRVDPVIFRIGFAVTLFFGGLGALLYIALMIFVPSEQADGTPGKAMTFGRVVLLSALAIAGLIGMFFMGLAAAWAAATGSGVVVAIIVILIGAALVVAAFNGGARWLILPALALAVPLGTVAAADIRFEGGVGETSHRPQTIQAIPAGGYEYGVGDQRIDLRGLDWTKDRVIRVEAEQGIGRMLILVPENVCVDGDIDAEYGVVEIAGEESSGSLGSGYEATPRLELDAHIDAGKIEVINDDDVELNRGHTLGDIGRAELRDRMAAACAPEPQAKGGRDA
ncbi:MAG TPA: PspC domain-containing protein [Thermoanaerobaculia bacterium]|nr:PspC domain-containing protein [Thermoanaerobaculia bacterium]